MACAPSSSPSPLIIDISPRVLDNLCRCVDTLSDWEWMRFASHVMNDQTTLQRFYMRRRSGDYVTRELLWSWGQKLATVQDLEVILQKLELLRALEILGQYPCSPVTDERRGNPQDSGGAERNCGTYNGLTRKEPDFKAPSLPSPPQPPSELLRSLSTDSYPDPVLRTPQQENSLSLNTTCQHWTIQQLEEATEGFSASRRIHRGQFADVFMGRRGDCVYAIKRVKEVRAEPSDKTESFYEKEAQIGFRCHHPNLLKLLGFCTEDGHHHLIHRFMTGGSLDVVLQKAGSCVLGWEKRLSMAISLLDAVDHLHKAGIFHGNIKSSNVLLDENFTARLGHATARPGPDRSPNYTIVKTQELQRFQPYLPDSYLRSGQLTAHTDIFSCGVVLAELLTGLKPTDKDRDPTYLKDLILSEVEQVKLKNHHGAESVDLLCARDISQKYSDQRLERLGRSSAVHWASAVCLCLTKKRVLLSEVMAMMEKAQEAFTDKELKEATSSVNIPEESDESLSLSYTHREVEELPSSSCNAARSMTSVSVPETTYSSARNQVFKKSPCELDESGSFDVYPGDSWYLAEPTSSEAAASSAGYPAKSYTSTGNIPQEVSHSPTESNEPSWGIEVNEAKLKLMENIGLYAENRVDSSVLFDSS
ncbi:interleukin-1 receptor-associated kinase-like 2 [Engystomops pustulosus]|uniref:interleukin-1 receptor-associated kinase-like 2 n=1 Tax=Engystomops pustulosus TaxID=76066 RepID=UPI003AFA703E